MDILIQIVKRNCHYDTIKQTLIDDFTLQVYIKFNNNLNYF